MELVSLSYFAILVAYSIFLVVAFKEPKVSVLAILAGIATIAIGVASGGRNYILLGIAMLVLGVAPLVPVAVREELEEEG